jgi:hypothetical protein
VKSLVNTDKCTHPCKYTIIKIIKHVHPSKMVPYAPCLVKSSQMSRTGNYRSVFYHYRLFIFSVLELDVSGLMKLVLLSLTHYLDSWVLSMSLHVLVLSSFLLYKPCHMQMTLCNHLLMVIYFHLKAYE